MKTLPFRSDESHKRFISFRISAIYMIVGGLWILLSDLALEALTTNPRILTYIAIIKGGLYVGATGLMLYVLINRGITAIQKSQQALRSTEAKYRELVENANSIIMRRDPQGIITFFNEFALHFFGYSSEEIIGKHVVGTIVPEMDTTGHDLARMIRDIGADPDGYRSNVNENMLRNGERVWIAWTNKAIRDEDGKIVEILCVGNDITDRRRVEEALRENEEKYRLFFDNMPDVAYRADNDGKVIFVSPSVERVFGYSVDESLGMNLAETVYADPRKRRELLAILKQKGEAREFEALVRRKDGSRIWVSTNSRFFKDAEGKIQGVEGVVRDITERKLAEIELKQVNDYLENILENSPDAIGIVDRHGRFIKWNRMSSELFGYSFDQISQMTAFDLYATEAERARLLSELRRDGVIRSREVNMRHLEGFMIPVELSVSILKDDFGNSTGSIAIARDLSEIKRTNERLRREIAERRRIEEALRESENTYRAIFEHTGAATVIIEEDTTITLANSECENLSGYSKEEIEGKMSWTAFVAEPDLSRMGEYHRRRRIDPSSAPRRYEFELRHREGHYRNILSTVGIIPGTGKTVASFMDITEQKKLEEELARADKLESVGVLAGGIAHDFNNILGAIIGNLSLARLDVDPSDRLSGLLEEAENAAVRAKDLTYQLLTFSRGGAPVKKILSVLGIIKESTAFALHGSNVRCQIDAAEDLWPVEADAGQISQVINNLIINAKQAMPGGGLVEIATANVILGETSEYPLDPGKYLRISIKDHGTGIPKEHQQKIFDPYFTTKQAGSGLGLATSYSIVRKHGGYLAVESELGVGATFHLYLPACDKPLESWEQLRPEPIRGKGKVLLMDDDDMLRRMATLMLTQLGYQVTPVADGLTAIEAFRQAREAGEPFDAVILDLTIPGGISGAQTVRKLIEIDPTVKALASSGYSNDPVMARFAEYGFRGVIAKPYAVREMADVLREILKDVV